MHPAGRHTMLGYVKGISRQGWSTFCIQTRVIVKCKQMIGQGYNNRVPSVTSTSKKSPLIGGDLSCGLTHTLFHYKVHNTEVNASQPATRADPVAEAFG